MKARRPAIRTRRTAVHLSDAERQQADAERAAHMARFASGAQRLQRLWVAVVVPFFVAHLVWGVTITQMPALGCLGWPAASATIYLALRRWARSASATTAVFGAGLVLQIVVQVVRWPGRS